MSRAPRVRRDLPVSLDVQALWRIAERLGANHKQFRNAYSRALQRTSATMRKKGKAALKAGLALRSPAQLDKRLQFFRLRRTAELDTARMWFGLNAIKVKDLRGRVRGRVRPRHTARDPDTGRYARARRRQNNAVSFEPKGSMLKTQTFENGEVGNSARESRRTVFIRDPVTRRTREAEIDAYRPLLDYVEDFAYAELVEVFNHHFIADLRGRLKMNIDV